MPHSIKSSYKCLVDTHDELGSILKRCGPYVVNLFNQTPIFELHMTSL